MRKPSIHIFLVAIHQIWMLSLAVDWSITVSVMMVVLLGRIDKCQRCQKKIVRVDECHWLTNVAGQTPTNEFIHGYDVGI